jgi:hypothetical protein
MKDHLLLLEKDARDIIKKIKKKCCVVHVMLSCHPIKHYENILHQRNI